MKKTLTNIASSAVLFVLMYFLSGWFLMPYLPPTPDRPVSVFEGAYWIDNWAGLVLGVVVVVVNWRVSSARDRDCAGKG